jgi:hypothetical protein
MSRWHAFFGRHSADLKGSRWDAGRFVTDCLVCGLEMVKQPGGQWALSPQVEPRAENSPVD